MIRVAMQLHDGTVGPEVLVSNIVQGLCIQKDVGVDDITYGVMHHSGLLVAPCLYRYVDAVALQQRLLALPIDWTQSVAVLRDCWENTETVRREVGAVLALWDTVHAVGE